MGGRHAQGPGALQPNGELKVEATMEVSWGGVGRPLQAGVVFVLALHPQRRGPA